MRGDSGHRLKSDVPRGATVAEQPVRLAAAQPGARCRGSPGIPCPRSRCRQCWSAGHAEDGIRVETQRLVDARGQQHEQVADPRGAVERGFDSPDPNRRLAAASSLASRCDQAAPNRVVAFRLACDRGLRNGVRQPCQRSLSHARFLRLSEW